MHNYLDATVSNEESHIGAGAKVDYTVDYYNGYDETIQFIPGSGKWNHEGYFFFNHSPKIKKLNVKTKVTDDFDKNEISTNFNISLKALWGLEGNIKVGIK